MSTVGSLDRYVTVSQYIGQALVDVGFQGIPLLLQNLRKQGNDDDDTNSYM